MRLAGGILGGILTLLGLPSIRSDVQGWAHWLKWVDGVIGSWVIPLLGLGVLVAAVVSEVYERRHPPRVAGHVPPPSRRRSQTPAIPTAVPPLRLTGYAGLPQLRDEGVVLLDKLDPNRLNRPGINLGDPNSQGFILTGDDPVEAHYQRRVDAWTNRAATALRSYASDDFVDEFVEGPPRTSFRLAGFWGLREEVDFRVRKLDELLERPPS